MGPDAQRQREARDAGWFADLCSIPLHSLNTLIFLLQLCAKYLRVAPLSGCAKRLAAALAAAVVQGVQGVLLLAVFGECSRAPRETPSNTTRTALHIHGAAAPGLSSSVVYNTMRGI